MATHIRSEVDPTGIANIGNAIRLLNEPMLKAALKECGGSSILARLDVASNVIIDIQMNVMDEMTVTHSMSRLEKTILTNIPNLGRGDGENHLDWFQM
jgi:hypothetical protein